MSVKKPWQLSSVQWRILNRLNRRRKNDGIYTTSGFTLHQLKATRRTMESLVKKHLVDVGFSGMCGGPLREEWFLSTSGYYFMGDIISFHQAVEEATDAD